MEQSITTVVLVALAIILTWQVMGASARWRRGRGLLRRPVVVESENMERMWRAKSDRAQGLRELLRSIGQWMVAMVLIFVLVLLWSGASANWP